MFALLKRETNARTHTHANVHTCSHTHKHTHELSLFCSVDKCGCSGSHLFSWGELGVEAYLRFMRCIIENHISEIWHERLKHKVIMDKESIWILIPGTMSKMYPSLVSNMCWHGCGSEGTLMHMLWYCPAVKQFWQDIVNDLTAILNTEVALCPMDGHSGMDGIRSRNMQHILSHAFLVAKRTILIDWKKRKIDFMDILAVDRLPCLSTHWRGLVSCKARWTLWEP